MINQLVYHKSSENFNCTYIISTKFLLIRYILDGFSFRFSQNAKHQTTWLLQKINKKVYIISPKIFCYSKITSYLCSVLTLKALKNNNKILEL